MVDLTDILKDMVRAREEGKQIEMTAARECIDMIEKVSPKQYPRGKYYDEERSSDEYFWERNDGDDDDESA